MSIKYPLGQDTFLVPVDPEDTSLSATGGGGNTRDHTEHHEDLGNAVMALEEHASQKNHTHDGSNKPGGGPKLAQANTHEDADTDTDDGIHHTLGKGHTQAAHGDHGHSYDELRDAPLQICTSRKRPEAPVPGTLIYETDTNRMRVWAKFPDNSIADGLYSVEDFNINHPKNMGTAWEQYYTHNENTRGRLITKNGQLQWDENSSKKNRCMAARSLPADSHTQSNDQIITFKVGDFLVEYEFPTFEDAVTNDFYLRMSDNLKQYIVVKIGWNKIFVMRPGDSGLGWQDEHIIGTIENVETTIKGAIWTLHVNDGTLYIYRDGEELGAIHVGTQWWGVNFRRWGTGMTVSSRLSFFGQTFPSNIDWIKISDEVKYNSIERWTLLPTAQVPVTRLHQSRKQKFQSSGTIVQFDVVDEDNFSFFNSHAPTDLRITEPGIYHVSAAIQWDDYYVPNWAQAFFLLNGEETNIREHRFLRGSSSQLGVSQTLPISGKIRFARNDILRLMVKYDASNALLDAIYSFVHLDDKIDSHIEIVYLGP